MRGLGKRITTLALLLWVVMMVGACDSGSGGGSVPASTGADGGAAATAEGACAGLNLTKACQCGALSGAQSCLTTGWGPCQCDPAGGVRDSGLMSDAAAGAVPAGNLRDDLKFSWTRTPPSDGSCEPGYYVGTFQGVYFSSALFGAVPLPVAASGTPARPGLAFTLEDSGGGERLEITDGWMVGTANSVFPFEATITGGLDCSTLEFDAIMDGGYWTEPAMTSERLNFVGPIIGVYNKVTHTIQMGTWELDEYNPEPTIPSGGSGTWQAGWQP